ncbi:MAG: MCP four helix bundle domain-containing protein [Thermoleophilia bacterium]
MVSTEPRRGGIRGIPCGKTEAFDRRFDPFFSEGGHRPADKGEVRWSHRPNRRWEFAVLRRFRVAPRILGAFSVVLALMLVAGGIGIWGMAKIQGEAQFVQTDVLPAVKGLGEVDANFREGRARTSWR